MQPNEQPDDPTLRAALFNVKAPSGMRQRVLERLRAEAAAEEAAAATTPQLMNQPTPHTASVLVAEGAAASHTHAPDYAPDHAPASSALTVDLARSADLVAGSGRAQGMGRTQRRQWATALALSIVALAALGVYQWTRPTSSEQLAQFTLGQLDRLLSDNAVWQTEFDPQLAELSVLDGQLRFNIRPVGFQDQSGGDLAAKCRVWKLYSLATHKVFFVFDFQQADQVQSLTRHLQELTRSSGGWSLVAMQAEGRLVVLAVEGRVDSYLYQRQSA